MIFFNDIALICKKKKKKIVQVKVSSLLINGMQFCLTSELYI